MAGASPFRNTALRQMSWRPRAAGCAIGWHGPAVKPRLSALPLWASGGKRRTGLHDTSYPCRPVVPAWRRVPRPRSFHEGVTLCLARVPHDDDPCAYQRAPLSSRSPACSAQNRRLDVTPPNPRAVRGVTRHYGLPAKGEKKRRRKEDKKGTETQKVGWDKKVPSSLLLRLCHHSTERERSSRLGSLL